jgi:hypothetical protein
LALTKGFIAVSNSLAKDLEIMFENFVEGYDAACVISREAMTSFPDPKTMQRAGDTFYRMQDYNATVTTGLDVSGATKTDVIQRMVPTVFRSPDNVVFQLDAKELRDPTHKERMGAAASRRLSAEIDKNLYSTLPATRASSSSQRPLCRGRTAPLLKLSCSARVSSRAVTASCS